MGLRQTPGARQFPLAETATGNPQRDDASGRTGDAGQRYGSDGGAATRELVSARGFARRRSLIE